MLELSREPVDFEAQNVGNGREHVFFVVFNHLPNPDKFLTERGLTKLQDQEALKQAEKTLKHYNIEIDKIMSSDAVCFSGELSGVNGYFGQAIMKDRTVYMLLSRF